MRGRVHRHVGGGEVIRDLILRESEVRVTWNLGPSIFLVRKKYWRELTSGPPSQMPKKNDEKVPYFFAVLLALLVRRHGYVTKRIDQRRGSRAITEATGRRLRASMAAKISKPDIIFLIFRVFSSSVG